MPDQDSIKKPALQGEDYWADLERDLIDEERIRILKTQNDEFPEIDPRRRVIDR